MPDIFTSLYRKLVIQNQKIKLRKIRHKKDWTKFYPEENIFITGSPRSGTTWLAELLEDYTAKIMLFEPLALTKCHQFQELGFSWRQHIPEIADWPEAEKAFRDVFEGKNLNLWMMSHSDLDRLDGADSLIIKSVRSNLLLPWLINNFQFNHKPIYLVRHPFSTVASQLNLNWNDTPKFKVIQNQFNLSYEEPHKELIESAKSNLEMAVLRWCLDNAYLLNHPKNGIDWVTVYYENLFVNPQKEFKRIISELEIPLERDRLLQVNFNKASSTSFKETPSVEEKEKQLSKWTSKLSPSDVDEGLRLLDKFNINQYSEEVMPNC